MRARLASLCRGTATGTEGITRKEKTMSMTRVEEIQVAIESLSYEEYIRLRQWFSERDWEKWDRQIESALALSPAFH
jgi:hypothetical protein